MNSYLLALLPGLDGTGECFRPFCRILPPRFEPFVLGYPCHTILTYEETVHYIATRLPKDRRIVLLGESYGGPVALRIADQYPDKIAALVLCATFVTPPCAPLLRILSAILPVSLLLRHPPRLLLRYFMAGRDASDEYINSLLQSIRAVRGSVLSSRVRNIAGVDMRRELAECRVPILYMYPDSDKLIGTTTTEEIIRIRPDISVAHIPGPHQILQQQPQQAFQAISEFLDTSVR